MWFDFERSRLMFGFAITGPVVDPAAPIGENDTPEIVIQRAIVSISFGTLEFSGQP